MRPFFISLVLIGTIGLVVPARIPGGIHISENVPDQDTPQKLTEAWLRFHETDLCQGVDAVFVFNKNGMEAWCLIEDERSYQKLQELLEPLHNSCRIELYATHPPVEKKSENDRDPPPSLWENYELRSYLGDPFARAKERLGPDMPREMDVPPMDEMLKQRLWFYATQTLEWNRRMRRYAVDLPVLASVAFDPAVGLEIRSQARAACRAHAQNLGKYLGKLEANLTQALPRFTKGESPPAEKNGSAGRTPVDSADQIAVAAQSLARRVYRFIHPEHYTVGLDELRQPSLLQSLRTLDMMGLDFEKTLAKRVKQ